MLGALAVDHELGILFGVENAVHTYKSMICGKKWRAWVGTVVHEATHARDIIEYVELGGASTYDEINNDNEHRMFLIWSEFNAKRHGYYFVRKYTFDDIYDTAQVPDIMNTELQGQIENMFDQYNSTTRAWDQVYTVSQFLGRYSVWEDLFPMYFTPEFRYSLLKDNTWMLDMYEFLNANRKLSEAINYFDNLRSIMQSNFKDL